MLKLLCKGYVPFK